jgi:ribosomal-protein-alanine N-acetyltransferase
VSGLVVLRPDDATRMAHLHSLAFSLYEQWSAESFSSTLDLTTTLALGIESDIGLKAMIVFQRVDAEAEILTLATAPAFQRQGLAAQLLQHGLDLLGQYGTARLMLDVAADNFGAITFYERHGFAPDGCRPNYYRSGRDTPVDALLMSRAIAGQG